MSTNTRKARWMLVAALAAGLAGSAVAPRAASADEVVRTNMEASLRARPGERAPTLAHLDEGQTVRVLGRQGRWLKVSVKGKVGWITRTQVDDAEPVAARATADKKRTVGAKARKKGWSSRDDQAVGADAVEGEDAEDEASMDEAKAADDSGKADAAEEAEAQEMLAKDSDKEEKGMKAKKVAAKPRKKMEKITKGGEVVALRSTTVHAKPSKKSDGKWDADKGTTLTVVAINEQGDWVKVKDESGDKGWVRSKDLQARAMDDEDSGAGDAVAGGDDENMPTGLRKQAGGGGMAIWAQANVGILTKQQTYTSEGNGLRANYALANTAPAVIGGMGLARNMGNFTIGADAAVIATMGGAGVTVQGDETLAWKAVQIEAHAMGAYVLSPEKGYALAGRAGYHVSSVQVAYSETAQLPSEKLSGFLLGAMFQAPRLTEKIGMHVGADFMLGGTLLQTKGLADGETSATAAFFVNAGALYRLTSHLNATMTYQMALEGFAFGGENQREASAEGAARRDLQHVVGLGMAYNF